MKYFKKIQFEHIAAGVILVLTLSLTFSLAFLDRQSFFNRLEHLTEEANIKVAEKLYHEFSKKQALTTGLAAYVIGSEHITLKEFERFASTVLASSDMPIMSLQIAPNSVVSYIYPLSGNEAAIGHDLNRDPIRDPWVQHTKMSRSFTLEGPVELIQGGQAMIGRTPVYINVNGQDVYWGLVIVLTEWTSLLDRAKFNDQQEISHFLTISDPLGNTDYHLGSIVSSPVRDPYVSDFIIGNRSWTLYSAPSGGWPIINTVAALLAFIGIIISLSFTAFVYFSFKQRSKSKSKTEKLQQELVNLIENANAPIFGVDLHGNINEWNKMTEKITGFRKKEVLGKNFVQNYISGDYKAKVAKILSSALKGKATANYELPLFTKDKRKIIILLNATTRKDAGGKINGVIGIGQDLTELDRVRSETAAVATELTELIRNANVLIFGVDLHGNINEWNKKSEKVLGYSKKEILGKNWLQMLTREEDRGEVEDKIKKVLNREYVENYKINILAKNKKIIKVLLSSTPRFDASKNLTGVLGIGTDITKQEKLESKVIELNEVREKFIRILSHQLRTPLTAIRWNLETLITEGLGKVSKEQKAFLRATLTAETNVIARVDDLLALVDIKEGRIKLDKEKISLDNIWKSVVNARRNQLDLKLISIAELPSSETIPSIKADKRQIRSIMDRLLDNAVKYTPDKGKIRFRFKKINGMARFEIKDTGIGIPDGEKDEIFTDFFRASNAGGMVADASGISLAISKYYIEAHGGDIGFVSTEGKGSTFWFELPPGKIKKKVADAHKNKD